MSDYVVPIRRFDRRIGKWVLDYRPAHTLEEATDMAAEASVQTDIVWGSYRREVVPA